jgi:hypothetical protein
LDKIKKGKYCPSCRQKIKNEMRILMKRAWTQAVQTVYIENFLNEPVPLRMSLKKQKL